MMRTAILLTGHLRTFFMPLREDPSKTLASEFKRQFVDRNPGVDVFIITEPEDFWLDGVHYCRELHIANSDGFRLGDKIRRVDVMEWRLRLPAILAHYLGDCVKHVGFDDNLPIGAKYDTMRLSGTAGVCPRMFVAQQHKIRTAWDRMIDYSTDSLLRDDTFNYDIVMRTRFDNRYMSEFKPFVEMNWDEVDVYVPGSRPLQIYDWYSIGKREAMKPLCNLYDVLDDIPPQTFFYECPKCHFSTSGKQDLCVRCILPRPLIRHEITIASEHYLYRAVQRHRIHTANGGGAYVYRYRENNDLASAIVNVPPGVKVINHTPDSGDKSEVVCG